MANPQPKSTLIRRYIVEHVAAHPDDIAARTAARFRISRQAVHRHLQALEQAGVLCSEGRTRGRRYRLAPLKQLQITLNVAGLQEHRPWLDHVRPLLADLPDNVVRICDYGFSEMLNNVIDHSGSPSVTLSVVRNAEFVDLQIADHGIGIFRKIKEDCGLHDEFEAVAELAKGKLTSDPRNHTGEGIFFTSRAFDTFAITSGSVVFTHVRSGDNWSMEKCDNPVVGTHVRMAIAARAKTRLKDVFDSFTSQDGEFDFNKTHVPVKLLEIGQENLVSRSQARRLVARFERFREAVLDFKGVKSIGQAFADEIFRVYAHERPDLRLIPMNMSPDVQAMVGRALRRSREQ